MVVVEDGGGSLELAWKDSWQQEPFWKAGEDEVLWNTWPPEVEVQILLDQTWLQKGWVECWWWKTGGGSLELAWKDAWQQ